MASPRFKPLTLLHVFAGPFPTVQGTQALVATTCRLLAEKGHDVHLLTYAHGGFEREEPFTVHRIPGVPRFKKERSGPDLRKLALDLSLAARCRSLVETLRPSLIHAHHYEALMAAALADPLRLTPRVLHLHALMEPELQTYMHRSLARPMRAIGAWMDGNLPFLADRIVALDGDGRDAIVRRGFPEGRVVVGRVPACPPPGYVPEAREGRENDVLRAVYAGNLDRYQGLDVLLDAIRRLERVSSCAVRLEIVTASETSALEAKLRKLGLEGSVGLSRHGNAQEVFRFVASSDLAIIPRSARGGVPIKLVNAFAAGLPIIADRELAEHVAHGEEAWLVDMRSSEALACGISVLAASKELRVSLSRGALGAALRLHDPSAYAATLERVYRDLVLR
jgi:glycosyltransferase involved in cell wall biosynthesis